jgi:polysaccharide export outer membrane protein
VIRERDNIRTEFVIDLTQKSVFNSPAYFLQQNDVIYIEPTLAAQTQGTFWRTSLPTIVGLASFVVTTIFLITR